MPSSALRTLKEKPIPAIALALNLGVLILLIFNGGGHCKAISTENEIIENCGCFGYKMENTADYGVWLAPEVKRTYRCVGFLYRSPAIVTHTEGRQDK